MLEAYLGRLEVPDPPNRKIAKRTPIVLPPQPADEGLEISLHAKLTTLKRLVDDKARQLLCDFAKDVQLSLDGLLRLFCGFVASPDSTGIDIQKIEGILNNIQESFKEKHREFLGSEPPQLEEVFFSLKDTLTELGRESQLLAEKLQTKVVSADVSALNTTAPSTAGSVAAVPNPTLANNKVEDPPKSEKGKKADPKTAGAANLLTKLSGFFKRDETYAKTDLGKDSSSMKWDPIKKK